MRKLRHSSREILGQVRALRGDEGLERHLVVGTGSGAAGYLGWRRGGETRQEKSALGYVREDLG